MLGEPFRSYILDESTLSILRPWSQRLSVTVDLKKRLLTGKSSNSGGHATDLVCSAN